MNYVRQLNREHFAEDPIAYGGALNYGRKNIDAEIKRMQKKCGAGASFFLTQPIYSDEDIERIRYIKSRIDTKIICGIMPLVSYRNAVFMKNEITGIHVPDEIIAQYDKDMSREEEYEKEKKYAKDVRRAPLRFYVVRMRRRTCAFSKTAAAAKYTAMLTIPSIISPGEEASPAARLP